MADLSSPLQFEDVPLNEARRMGRGGPRMEPMLYDTLRSKIQSLSTEATRIHLGPEIRPQRMKNYILRIARELNVPVTIRRVPNGVIFWRSSEEDLQQAQEAASRLRGRRQPETTRHGRRRRVSYRHLLSGAHAISDEEAHRSVGIFRRGDRLSSPVCDHHTTLTR